MRFLLRVVLLAFAPWVLAAVVGGQRTSSADCRKCDATGKLACKAHPGEEGKLEDEVEFCSHVIDCESCAGVGFVDCPKCDRADVEAALEQRRAELVKAPGRWAALDEAMDRDLAKIETAHFVLVFEIESLKVGRKRLKAHPLHHLYAQRLEEIYTLYCEELGVGEGEFAEKVPVFVWKFSFDQEEGSLRFCKQSGIAGVRLHGVEPAYSVCGARSFFPKDEDLHRNLAHNVAQVLFSHQNPSGWIGNRKGGWAEEGLAHWFEDRLFGRCDNFCYEEQASHGGMRAGNFKLFARKLVERDAAPAMAQVFEQNSDTLSPDMRVVAMSYVDYLLERDGARFGQLGKQLRAGESTRDALGAVFELTPLEFERRWKAWVLETYPVR